MDLLQQWPPVTRVLVVSAALLSCLIHAQMINGVNWIFLPDYIFQIPPKIPELWRIYTSFVITGSGLNILFECYFLYTYSSGLELGSPRFTEHGSYFVYITFLWSIITLLGGYILGGYTLLNALVLSLAYTFSQDNPNANVTIFVLSFPAKYLPYALLFITLVSGGPHAAKIQASGLVAAHMYDFLTRIWPTFGNGRNYITTPLFVKRWFTPGTGTTSTRSYGTAFNPRQEVPGNTGWTGQRGPGRRLGD